MLYLPAFLVSFTTGLIVPAVPIFIKSSFDVTFATASLAMTAALLGSACATLPVGRLLDTSYRRRVTALGPALMAVAAAFLPRSGSFAELLAWQLLSGWGFQMWMLGRLAVIGDKAPRELLGRQVATMIGFESAGRMLGPVAGGMLVSAYGLETPFAAQGILCGVLSLILLWPRASGKPAAEPPQPPPGSPTGLLSLITNPVLGTLLPIQVLAALTRGSLLAGVIDLYMVYFYNLSASELGTFRGATLVICLPAALLAGVVMDKFGRKATLIPGFMLISTGFLGMAAVAAGNGPFLWFACGYVLAYTSTYFTAGSMQTLAIDAAPSALRGRYLGLLRLSSECGSALSCFGFGVLAAATGYAFSFVMLAVCGGFVAVAVKKFVTETHVAGSP